VTGRLVVNMKTVNRRAFLFILQLLVLISVLSMSAFTLVKQNSVSEATVFVSPSSVNVRVNQTFEVTINVSGVSDLYGWEFKLGYNTSLLEMVNTVEGSFLNGSKDTYFVPKVMSTDGYILAGCTSLRNVAGVNGNGTLATVEFRAKTLGSCSLDLYDTKLVNSAKQLVEHSEIDGTVTASGCVVIRVQYLDSFPRSGADVDRIDPPPTVSLGTSNESGYVVSCGVLGPGDHLIQAWYSGSQFGPNTGLEVNGAGDGSATITNWNLEITPPTITVLSPENSTYSGRIVPLNFTVNDYSPISWMGYSLDGQANATVTGNITLNVGAGSHSVVVYANDTYGNMGSSNVVYFSSLGGCVVIRVQYLDGCPRSNAEVRKTYPLPHTELGTTNESGLVTSCNVLSGPQSYTVKAYWPDAFTQFGSSTELYVDSSGNGQATIWANYEITPPAITILSPQNQTYPGRNVPLTYSIYDYSSISWTGYSLNGQANTTLYGNTTLNLSKGSYSIVVYSNDTYGNMGSSGKVYFTVQGGCVTIRVQYLDGSPRSGADVAIVTPSYYLGITGEDGEMTNCNHDLSEGDYSVKALFSGSQFGPHTYLHVDGNGDGSATIRANYEITPPTIQVLSPQNLTYTNGSVPLTFTVYDYSSISWIGYSLDNQPNTTITGNTTLTVEDGTHRIVVYANDSFGNMGCSQIVYFTIGEHDIAVANITVSKTIVGQAYSTSIKVIVENKGDYTETFNVTVYANITSIATQTLTLTSGNSSTITLLWNTTGFVKGYYTIWAYAWPVAGETYTADNTLTDGWVIVTIPGDVNGDRLVDISDLVITVGTIPSAPGWPNWNPNADINSDGVCDVSDLVICVGNVPSGPW